MSALLRGLVVSLALAAPAGAQECNFSAGPPADWRRMDTPAMSLYLPPDAYAKDISSDHSTTHRFLADGVDVLIDYGLASQLKFDESGAVSRLLGGSPASVLTEVGDRGGGRIGAGWSHLGPQQRLAASLSIRVGDAAHWDDACRIAASVRLLGDVSQLTLLRIGKTDGGQRFAEVVGSDARKRRLFVGDYASLNWGRISAIDSAAIVITELLRGDDGGYTQRQTRIERQR